MASPLFGKLKGAISSQASKLGKSKPNKVQEAIQARQKIVLSMFALKWGGAIALVIFLLISAGGVVSGVGSAIQNLGSINCSVANGGKFISEAKNNGIDLTDEQKKSITDSRSDNSCGGVGYNGQTYPPTQGIISTLWGVVDALHPNPHSGLDIASYCDTPIYAFAGGTVVSVVMGSEQMSTAGTKALPMGSITIQHTDEFSTSYLHTKGSTTKVKVGDIVSAGDVIAAQWSNGLSTGCHLHFMTFLNGENVDPLPYLLGAGYPYSTSAPYLQPDFPPIPNPGDAASNDRVALYPPGSAKSIAAEMLPTYGWGDEQFNSCLVPLWNRESGWRTTAQNNAYNPNLPGTPENQAYGIPQAAPGSKMATSGADWKTNPRTQIAWGLDYIKSRYGSPCKAWQHSQNTNWY